MATHSSTLAWKIPWTEEPGGLQSVGSLGVRHDWATSLSLFNFMHWRRKWQPTPVFLHGESQGRRAWWAAVYGVAQSRTRLKRLSRDKWSDGKEVWLQVCMVFPLAGRALLVCQRRAQGWSLEVFGRCCLPSKCTYFQNCRIFRASCKTNK